VIDSVILSQIVLKMVGLYGKGGSVSRKYIPGNRSRRSQEDATQGDGRIEESFQYQDRVVARNTKQC
ncbi:MAG: hypothetical protein L6300_17280, partial [Syntrophaceae bacterium]|nr:hypothetical protein [Syntrophaceae bacterium]